MPYTASFNFYGSVHDFLRPAMRNKPLVYTFNGSPSVKDAIEAIGIPHTEVSAIIQNGEPAMFTEPLRPDADVAVYAWELEKERADGYLLAPKPARPFRFVLDVHLGTLAKALRMLGFDTVYSKALHDAEIARIAESEQRIVLTRDIGLLKQKIITHGHWLRSQHTTEQLAEVISRYNLLKELKPMERCLLCNSLLRVVEKERVVHRLPPKTQLYFNEYYHCASCDKVYWKGSHYEHMQQVIQQIKSGNYK